MEDLRAKFLEADVDGSGFLSVEELWNAVRKMGAEVELEDIVQLMSELDVDRNGQLDVDEFVSLLRLGDQLQFSNATSKNTYLRIKKARRLNPLDFLKSFKNMPTNFAPSFVHERWSTARQNLPSSVFRAQVDPQTMLWKDVLGVESEDLPADTRKGYKPYLRPIETSVGCSLTLIGAQGVPLPQLGQGQAAFKDDDIVKRAVRIAIEHAPSRRRELVHNAIQVPAQWAKADEDIWKFDTSDSSLRSVLFRTTPGDRLDQGASRLLLELVVYVRSGTGKVTEMSCGWCELPLDELSRQMTHKLVIHGGSPTAEVEIRDADLRTNRSGLAFMKKVLGNGVEKRLEVEVRPYSKQPTEIRAHMDMMPSTCLVHKALLYFASGFMNYKAERLLREAGSGAFRQPPGDVVISSFPRIYDCPDIVEELVQIWTEDIQPLIDKQKLHIDSIVTRTKEVVSRLYPVLYSEAFKGLEHASTLSSVADPALLEKRRRLIQSALRFGAIHAVKTKVTEAPFELTSYRPFAIRELEFDVWDSSRSK